MADDSRGDAGVDALMSALGGAYPCCYVSGNHEVRTGCLEALKRRFRSWGITVLEGSGTLLATPGGTTPDLRGWTTPPPLPASRVAGAVPGLPGADGGQPVHSAALPPAGADGMLPGQWIRSGGVGHAHGRQVRLPGMINGLFAPAPGAFPDYAGGSTPWGAPPWW